MSKSDNLVNYEAYKIALNTPTINTYWHFAQAYEAAKQELAKGKYIDDREPDLSVLSPRERIEMFGEQKPQLPELPAPLWSNALFSELERNIYDAHVRAHLRALYCEREKLITCLAAVYKHIEGK